VSNFVLPSTGFELPPLIHYSTIRLALRPLFILSHEKKTKSKEKKRKQQKFLKVFIS
jgi:hypothetical protein